MRLLSLLLAVLLLLAVSGCTPLLERSYHSVTPHRPFSDEAENPSILRAETYQGLVSALLYLVGQGKEEGVVRLYQYTSLTGSAASDVDAACLEVTQEDPLGAYAMDYIRYDVEQSAAYYEVQVSLAYTKSAEEIRSVISVTGSSAIPQELAPLLSERPEKVAFRISYFTASDSAEGIRQGIEQVCQEQQVPLAGAEVRLYPESGQQRLVELLLSWEAELDAEDGPMPQRRRSSANGYSPQKSKQ